MRKLVKISLYLFCLMNLLSCYTNKFYSKNDYSLYQRDFHLSDSALLRTDGVYLQTRIWTDENGGKERIPKEKKIYKFYNTGQANMILDIDNSLKTNQQYIDALNARINKVTPTLFEGYYQLNGKRMVIQSVNPPRNMFSYTYAVLESNKLIIVKSTIKGKGKIDDKFFTDYYKEYYIFVPTGDEFYMQPNW